MSKLENSKSLSDLLKEIGDEEISFYQGRVSYKGVLDQALFLSVGSQERAQEINENIKARSENIRALMSQLDIQILAVNRLNIIS